VWLAVSFGGHAHRPFVHFAGYNTYLATPWTFLRFFPVLSATRTPARFAIVLMLALAVLFGMALARLCAAAPRHARAVLAGVAVILFAELLPVPRTLYAASVPRIYDIIAADPDESAAVLELPSGVRDGTSAVGDFSSGYQFYQTRHQKRLVGGYLSRVAPWRISKTREIPILEGLMLADAGVLPTSGQRRKYIASGRQLVQAIGIRYVVVDRRRASAAAEQLAIDAFSLAHVADADHKVLFRTCPPNADAPCGHKGAHDDSR
jgi:hypothetical protein